MSRYIFGFLLSLFSFLVGLTLVVASIPVDETTFRLMIWGGFIMLVSGTGIMYNIERQQRTLGKQFLI